jgi:hypothetical protein
MAEAQWSKCYYDAYRNRIILRLWFGYQYEIPKERLHSPEAVLDWIHQVNRKGWSGVMIKQFLNVLFEVIPESFWAGRSPGGLSLDSVGPSDGPEDRG